MVFTLLHPIERVRVKRECKFILTARSTCSVSSQEIFLLLALCGGDLEAYKSHGWGRI